MNLQPLFEAAVKELKAKELSFAVAGGFAANLYRSDLRLTQDIDLLLFIPQVDFPIAKEIVESLGLKVGIVREADLAGGPIFSIRAKNTIPFIIGGRNAEEPAGPGVDFLLPNFPWLESALQRAQDNPVDYGFGDLPTMTLEDVLVAKLWALRASQPRAKDLDDIQSIYAANPEIDWAYLAAQIYRWNIELSKGVQSLLPKALVDLCKDALRANKNRLE